MRYFLEITYNGTAYHGWQIQRNAVTVQEVINKCLSLKLGEEIQTTGCGRTDTGVHASQFFLHFDFEKIIKKSFVNVINAFLPQDIVVRKIYKSPANFNARWDAASRTYTYIITQGREPLMLGYSAIERNELDIEKMNLAAETLTAFSDFTALSKVSKDEEHHLCTITKADWKKNKNKITFTITSNRFLRGMVRIVVGTLLEVGKGKISIEDFKNIISNRDRKKAAAAAPASGLFLSKVIYPKGKLKPINI